MSLESKRDATLAAQQVIDRAAQIVTLVGELPVSHVLNLACAEASQLKSLLTENAAAAERLAAWILREPPPDRESPPSLSPQICLTVSRPNSPPAHIEVGGIRVTPPMLDAAEDLLNTLTTGERQLPRDLYEVVARAFNTSRDDAKGRILLAIYGKKIPPP